MRPAEVAAAALVLLAAVAVATRIADRPMAASSAASSYVVKPGDTLIGIAQRFDGGGDPYPLIYRLELQTRSSAIYPGERLRIPRS